jgi:hypothetical protein
LWKIASGFNASVVRKRRQATGKNQIAGHSAFQVNE